MTWKMSCKRLSAERKYNTLTEKLPYVLPYFLHTQIIKQSTPPRLLWYASEKTLHRLFNHTKKDWKKTATQWPWNTYAKSLKHFSHTNPPVKTCSRWRSCTGKKYNIMLQLPQPLHIYTRSYLLPHSGGDFSEWVTKLIRSSASWHVKLQNKTSLRQTFAYILS